MFSETSGNKDFRTDSDFWTKEPQKNPKLKYTTIGLLLQKAQYGISVSMNEDGVGTPIYRMNEIHNMLCDLDVLKCAEISETEIRKFKLNDKDVVFNRTNSFQWVGRTGLYRKFDDKDFVFASYLVRFIPKRDMLTPEYLTTFLNSKYGVMDIKRRSRHSINQTNVNPEEVKDIEIPLLSMGFQNLIAKRFDKAHNLRIRAKKTYSQAEALLLFELGLLGKPDAGYTDQNLGDWVSDDPHGQMLANSKPGPREEMEMMQAEWDAILTEYDRLKQLSDYDGMAGHLEKYKDRLDALAELLPARKLQLHYIQNNRNIFALREATGKNTNIKSFSESFGATGRLDAEYYEKRYDVLETVIRKNPVYDTIGNIKTENFRGLQPEYAETGELDVINSKHILENTLDYDNFEKTDSHFWETQKRARVFKGDILTYTTGANIGRTQVYLIDKKALASNHVNILRLKKSYNPFYVGFVMNSMIGRLQTKKFSAGSAQAELYPKDIDQFIIPFCSKQKQNEIADLVEKSFTLKQQSEQLLEVAKTAVEMAIEKDEGAALEYVKQHGT